VRLCLAAECDGEVVAGVGDALQGAGGGGAAAFFEADDIALRGLDAGGELDLGDPRCGARGEDRAGEL
jgi:hypothetical protein